MAITKLSTVRREPYRPARLAVADMPEAGAVKWFDSTRRYGFVKLDGANDAFLHMSVLSLYGIKERDLVPGRRLRLKTEPPEIGQRPNVVALALV